jgi:hypothetical protein
VLQLGQCHPQPPRATESFPISLLAIPFTHHISSIHQSSFARIFLSLIKPTCSSANMKTAMVLAASVAGATAGMHRMPLKKVPLSEQLVSHYHGRRI